MVQRQIGNTVQEDHNALCWLKKKKNNNYYYLSTVCTFSGPVHTNNQALHEQEIPVTALLGASQNTSSENYIFCLKS